MNSSPHSRSIFFIAGEASGDAHAADLIAELKGRDPQLRCFGAGGPKMREAGMELVIDLTEHAVVGLVEVLQNYFKFRRFFHDLLRRVEERRPDAVVLIDYPAFNLRFARALHRRFQRRADRPRVIYYICPQVWAWAERRVKLIEQCVDLLLSIFPFEKDWFAPRAPKLRVEFVGHPIKNRPFDPQSIQRTPRSDRVVALLPGSREREVRVHWPILRAAAQKLLDREATRVIVLAASDRLEAMIRADCPKAFEISRDKEATLTSATISLTASGTATLECAYYGVPTIVLYKVAWPTYLVGRMLVKVKHLAMPNVLAGETVFPEFIQHHATPEAIAAEALDLLNNQPRQAMMRTKLASVIESLGPPGAVSRAAKLVLAELGAGSREARET